MELHLPLVLATPTLLCLLAAVAAIVWPWRVVLWPFVLPAMLLAAGCLGLLPCRDEIVGPAVRWLRLDVPGLFVNATALPFAAWWARRFERVGIATPLAKPHRRALWFALVAAIGLTPLPLAGVGGWPFGLAWRSPAAKCLALVLTVLAVACWPWPRLVDVATAFALFAFAWALRPTVCWQLVHRALVCAFGGVALLRAIALL